MSYCLQFPVLMCFLLIACDNTTPETASSEKPTITMASEPEQAETAKTPDYTGTYIGVLPCADCEGITTTLSLSYNNTFTLTTSKLGKKESTEVTKTGFYSFQKHESLITLIGMEAPNRYFAGENVLFLLDIQGNRVSGELAEKYILHKQ